MADPKPEPRTFASDTVAANRARTQGLGVGQQELNAQRDPNRDLSATLPDRPEPFEAPPEPGEEAADAGADSSARREEQLGLFPDQATVGTPPSVDPVEFEDGDPEQLDWGEPLEGATHGQNHTRRPEKTEAERGQGAKTRQRNKEIVSGKPFAR